MLIDHITDITPVGAYINAIEAAKERDRRDAKRRKVTPERQSLLEVFRQGLKQIAASVGDFREKKVAFTALTNQKAG
jgi:hypothetical protein